MARTTTLRNFIVGLVFLSSLIAVGVVTLKVTDISFDRHYLKIRFDQIKGLMVGNEVRIYGYRVGSVESIEFQGPVVGDEWTPGEQQEDRGNILAIITVNRELLLTKDTQFVVKSLGPLGGNYLEIIPGTGDIQALDVEFQGTSSPELFDELGDFIQENRDTIHNAINQIHLAVQAINEREGALGMLIKDPQVRDRISSFVENVEVIFREIREGRGTVGKLVMESTLHNDIGEIAKAVREGRGTLGKPVMEDTLHKETESFFSRADNILAGTEEGKGTLGMLFKDEGLADDIRVGVDELKDAIAKVNQGEGSFGQFVNNREAWDRLVFVLRQVQEAVEDFREQAPISTFVNAIFAAF